MKSFLDISEFCDCSFESDEWREWERVAKSLPELIKNGTLRKVVGGLPRVNLDGFKENEMKRAYTILTFISHAYIRGQIGDSVIKVLPENISKNWIGASNFLGLPPVATYTATVLFNFKGRVGSEPDDFEIEFTFTGTEDEKWFYAVSAAIDTQSDRIISCADRMFDEAANLNAIGEEITKTIEEMTRILKEMYGKCRPEVFFGQVRKYLAGWFNDPQLPDGLTYDLADEGKVKMKLAGGSAAQNPTIQLLDILLGVKHEADTEGFMISGYPAGCCPRMNYLGAMRTYMPREHRDYLNDIEKRLNASSVIDKFKNDPSYNSCVRASTNFRSEHIKMVARYIICQNSKALGTGGSNPIQFLKTCRDETEACLSKE